MKESLTYTYCLSLEHHSSEIALHSIILNSSLSEKVQYGRFPHVRVELFLYDINLIL